MLDLLIVIACLGINAFFSAYEMAFVTISREEIEELDENSSTRQKFSIFKKKPERTLSVIQIGITLVGAIAAAVGGTGAVESLEPYFVQTFDISRSFAEAIAVTVVIVPLTYFSVVFGELVPKTIALKHPLKIIGIGTKALGLFDSLLSPIVTFLEVSTNFLLKIIGLGGGNEEDESMGEMIEIGNLPDYHQRFVQNLVSLKGRKVLKAMIPWEKVAHLHFSDTEEEIRAKISASPHSRVPVIDGDIIVGMLLKKELPDYQLHEHLPWQTLIRPAIRVLQNQKVLEAFLKMQDKQIPLAIVEDENEKYIGIITIEDIIEEVVGDIKDKSDLSLTSKILSNRTKINLKK